MLPGNEARCISVAAPGKCPSVGVSGSGAGECLLWAFVLSVCWGIVILGLLSLSKHYWTGGERDAAVAVSESAPSAVNEAASSFPGYCVLFVDSSYDAGSVMQVLIDAGCTGVISAAGAEDVSDISALIAEVAPTSLRDSTPSGSSSDFDAICWASLDKIVSRRPSASSYPSRRGEYFTDVSGKYSLYYVPKKFASSMNKCLAAMPGVDAGVMGWHTVVTEKPSAARFVAVIAAAAVILCMMSGNVVRSVLSFSLPVFLAMMGRGVWSEISAAAALCAVFAARLLWTRVRSVRTVLKCGVAPAFALLSLAAGVIGGVGGLSAAVLAGSFAMLRLYHLIKKAIACRHIFCPVPILPSKVKWGTAESVSLGMGALMCVLFPIMGMGVTGEAVAQEARSDVGLAVAMPSVEDYCRWCWQCVTYPYTRLGGEESDTVSFPTYKEENGVIKQSVIEVKMDDDFRARCIAAIDELPAGAVEHLMKSKSLPSREAI